RGRSRQSSRRPRRRRRSALSRCRATGRLPFPHGVELCLLFARRRTGGALRLHQPFLHELLFSARMARTRDGSGISARSSGGSCCSLFSLSACSCAEPPPAGGGVRAKPVPARAVLLCRFARAFSLSFKAVSRRFSSRSRSSTAFSRASSSALRRARSAPASCFWQEETSAKEVTIKMPRFLFIR